MTNNELLLAISEMMDNKLESNLKPIGNRMERIETRMEGVETKIGKLETRMEGVETKIGKLETRMGVVETRIGKLETRMTNVELQMENDVVPRLQNIESCYVDTYRRYQDYSDKIQASFDDTELLKKVVMEHSVKLQKLA